MGGVDPGSTGDGDTGPVRSKIAIIGTAPGWERAPFDDPSWEIWGISRHYDRIPRWDKWFELHKRSNIGRGWDTDEVKEALARRTYLKWLGSQGDRVFVQEQMRETPDAKLFPIQALLKAFPRKYLTNTISYLTALAILLEPKEIGIWGVDMALDTEYGSQRPSCEYWIGVAEGRGIAVTIPPESDLLKTSYLYAYQDLPDLRAKMKAKVDEFSERENQVRAQMHQAQHALGAIKGAKDMAEYVLRTWAGG